MWFYVRLMPKRIDIQKWNSLMYRVHYTNCLDSLLGVES
jgi:hypothetical protein